MASHSGSVDVVIVGTGNAALCAAIAALEGGAEVLLVEKAEPDMSGGNSRYTAGAMRFAYANGDQLLPLLRDDDDPRVVAADFAEYPAAQFAADLVAFNDGGPITDEQRSLVESSYEVVKWLADHGIGFEPIWDRQSYELDGRHIFWGGLTLATSGEGVGLVDAEMGAVERLGGRIRYDAALVRLVMDGSMVVGVVTQSRTGELTEIGASSVVLACGGFEADRDERVRRLGDHWAEAKVRGTPNNTGVGLRLALEAGAVEHGVYERCHATPMDLHMPDYGNLDLAHDERKNYRKICYFLGVMLNAAGLRFVDEGKDFRNYTYAQFGRAVLEQPGQFAWQIFDAKVADLLYAEYRFHDAHFVEADTLEGVVAQLDGVDHGVALATLEKFNAAVDESTPFDPTVRDGRSARGLDPPRSNWAQRLDTPPFRAYPVTGGITFTYGGLRVGVEGQVMRPDGSSVEGLFACGELVGGVFSNGYPGGSGLTSGAVFGKRAGTGAARRSTG